MSKTIPAALKTHMQQTVTTLATCWRLVRVDGQEYFFTDHDVDLVVDGDTYGAALGTMPKSMQQSGSLAVDNLEVVTFLNSAKVTEADLMAGLFDYATIDIFLVNWASIDDGKLYLAQGWTIGEIEIRDHDFTAEIRGKAQHLQQDICELYSITCRADLGDAQCGVDLDSNFPAYSGSVTYVSEDRRVFIDDNLVLTPTSSADELDPIYEFGLLTWTSPSSGESYSGANAGYQMEVKAYDPETGEVELFQAMPNAIEVGDEFTLTYGCDKSADTCKVRYDNIINMRAEPFLPGPDRMLEVVSASLRPRSSS